MKESVKPEESFSPPQQVRASVKRIDDMKVAGREMSSEQARKMLEDS